MAKTSILQDGKGNASSSRLIGIIVIVQSLIYVGLLIWLAFLNPDQALGLVAAAGVLFTTMTGPTFYFLYNQKKQELTAQKSE